MSILIEGMEMPKTCEICPLVNRFVTVEFKSIKCKVTKKLRPDSCLTRPNSCPLVEVPEPHGRLIDADMLLEEFDGTYKYVALIKKAPTVIPAEEGE